MRVHLCAPISGWASGVEIVATSDAACPRRITVSIKRIDGSAAAAADGANEQINKLRFIETSSQDANLNFAERLCICLCTQRDSSDERVS